MVTKTDTVASSSSSRCLRITLLTIFVVLGIVQQTNGYLIVVSDQTPAGTVIFNASVYKLGSERLYKINAHKSAQFVHHLLHVDHKDGQIRLKKQLQCDGIFYPNIFTFYVDSTTNRLRSIDYYSLPLRILVSGENCNDETQNRTLLFGRNFEEENVLLDRRRRHAVQPIVVYGNELNNETDYKHFNDGDILFDSVLTNYERHKILSRKRRELQLTDAVYNKITEAKQWITETYASYAIHTTDRWNKICLKKSQYINSLNAFLPRSICQYCKVNFLDVSDERFKIEMQNRDLVASKDVCIPEPLWKVIVTLKVKCERPDLIDADHRLKIVYHHQEFNDTDMAKRVKRELRNQSPYFEQALYVASVLEEQTPGVTVTTVRARDPEDSPVVYSMVSLLDSRSQSMFKVDSRTGKHDFCFFILIHFLHFTELLLIFFSFFHLFLRRCDNNINKFGS